MTDRDPDHDPGHEYDPDELPQDDAVIGRALRISFAVLGAALAIAALVYALVRAGGGEEPESVIEASAPERVVAEARAPDVRFTDVTAAAGVDFVHFNGARGEKLLPETMGGGAAFLDYDGDGDQDLLFVNGDAWPHHEAPSPRPTMALYANDGRGVFSDVTRAAGLDVSFYGMGITAADYDGDDDVDLYFTAVGRNHLFRNEGGRFADVTAAAGVGGADDDWSTAATFFDADGDGDLDLFVGNYVEWSRDIDLRLDYRLTGVGRAYGPPLNYSGTYPRLYRNRGDGTFEDVSGETGIRIDNPATGLPVAKSLGLSPVDVDRDGALDLLVANDTVRNFYLRNRGDGTFEEIGEVAGLAYDRNGSATGAMGCDAGFYRNDDDLGFLIGNFANEMTSVYVAQGSPGFFADEAIPDGIGAPTRQALTFGVSLLDYDLDGRLDMVQANGHLEESIADVDPSQSYEQSAQLFWNAGPDAARGFVEVTAEAAGDLARPIVGRGSAYADIDADGDLDLLLTQTGGAPLLLRNDQQLGHHWLRVRLIGPPGNRDAIGAEIRLTAGGVTQTRIVTPTRSYLSQSELAATFGLGESTSVERIVVHWPDGVEVEVSAPEIDREIRVEHSSTVG